MQFGIGHALGGRTLYYFGIASAQHITIIGNFALCTIVGNTEVTRQTVAGAKFQVVDESQRLHKLLFRQTPSGRYRRKPSPTVLFAKTGSTVGTDCSCKHVLAFIVILNSGKS